MGAVGPFETLGVLGEGASAVVHRARRRSDGLEVALKVMRGTGGNEKAMRRFLRELRAGEALVHRDIARVIAVEADATPAWIALELLPGGTLKERLKRDGPFPPEAALALLARIARALHHAHERGFIHRDVKPANILFDAKGEPRLADFGLTKELARDSQLTRTGAIVGTPAYVAPEQARGEPTIDARTDVWALGCLLYECVTGAAPFQPTESLGDLLDKIVSAPPPPPLAPGGRSTGRAGEIALWALTKDPARRPASALAFARACEGALPRPPRRTAPVLAGVALLAVVGGGALLAARMRAPSPPPPSASEDLATLEGAVRALAGEETGERRTRAQDTLRRLVGDRDTAGATAAVLSASIAAAPRSIELRYWRVLAHVSLGARIPVSDLALLAEHEDAAVRERTADWALGPGIEGRDVPPVLRKLWAGQSNPRATRLTNALALADFLSGDLGEQGGRDEFLPRLVTDIVTGPATLSRPDRATNLERWQALVGMPGMRKAFPAVIGSHLMDGVAKIVRDVVRHRDVDGLGADKEAAILEAFARDLGDLPDLPPALVTILELEPARWARSDAAALRWRAIAEEQAAKGDAVLGAAFLLRTAERCAGAERRATFEATARAALGLAGRGDELDRVWAGAIVRRALLYLGETPSEADADRLLRLFHDAAARRVHEELPEMLLRLAMLRALERPFRLEPYVEGVKFTEELEPEKLAVEACILAYGDTEAASRALERAERLLEGARQGRLKGWNFGFGDPLREHIKACRNRNRR